MSITAASFDFRISAREPLILPAYKGATLRGGFGHAFRRVVCAVKNKDCQDCLLRQKCIYSYVFETPPPQDTSIMRKYRSAPHPFLIEPPPDRRRGYKTGDEMIFRFILIGRAVDYLPYFVYAFDELGKMGIGKGKARYDLKTVTSLEPIFGDRNPADKHAWKSWIVYTSETKTLDTSGMAILPLELGDLSRGWMTEGRAKGEAGSLRTLKISFVTPTRILYNGHLTIDLEFHIFIRNLLRRLALLSYFHCNGDPLGWNFKGIIEKARDIRVREKRLRWFDWERYSGRQDARLKMGGFEGDIVFEGHIDPFMQIVKAGEIVHVGKGTAFGLGKYKIAKDDSE